jgi:gamma-glutamyltranspeptidase/glutathione hydrolase
VAQVTHRWIDLEEGIRDAVNAPRIHVVPPDALYLESDDLEVGEDWIKASNFVRTEPAQDLMISGSNAYFGGVHAIAFENGQWVGVADPRRDGDVGYARR